MEISAIAFRLAISSKEPIKISCSPLYEEELKKFLEKNKGKTRDDFPHVPIYVAWAIIVLPTDYTSEHEYYLLVKSIEIFESFGMKWIKIGTNLTAENDIGESINGYMYASEVVFGNTIPEVGDDIQGILWLTAKAVG